MSDIEISRIKSQLNDYENRLSIYSKKITILTEENNKLKGNINELNSLIISNESKITSINFESNHLSESLNNWKNEALKSQKISEELRKSQNDFRQKLEASIHNHNSKDLENQNLINSLKEQILGIAKSNELIKNLLKEKEEAYELLKGNNRSIENHYSSELENLRKQIEILKNELNQKPTPIKENKEKFNKNDPENSIFSSQEIQNLSQSQENSLITQHRLSEQKLTECLLKTKELYSEIEKKNQQIILSNHNLEKTKSDNDTHIKKLEDALTKKNQEYSNLMNEYIDLRSLKDLKNNDCFNGVNYEEKYCDLRNKLLLMKDANSDMNQEIHRLKKDKKAFGINIDSENVKIMKVLRIKLETSLQKNHSFARELESLNSSMNFFEVEKSALNKQIKIQENQILHLVKVNEIMRKKLKAFEPNHDFSLLLPSDDLLFNDLSTLMDYKSKLEAKISQMADVSELEELKHKNQNLSLSLSTIESKYKDLKFYCEKLEKIDFIRSKLKDLNIDNALSNISNEENQLTLKRKRPEIIELLEDLENLRTENKKIKIETESTKRQSICSSNENIKLKSILEGEKRKKNTIESELKSKIDQISELQQILIDKENLIEIIQQKLQNYDIERENSQHKLDVLNQKLNLLEEMSFNLEEDKRISFQAIFESHNMFIIKENDFQTKLLKMQDLLYKCKKEKTELEEKLSLTNEDFQNKISEKDIEIESNKTSLIFEREQKEKLLKETRECHQKSIQLEKELESLKEYIESKNAANDQGFFVYLDSNENNEMKELTNNQNNLANEVAVQQNKVIDDLVSKIIGMEDQHKEKCKEYEKKIFEMVTEANKNNQEFEEKIIALNNQILEINSSIDKPEFTRDEVIEIKMTNQELIFSKNQLIDQIKQKDTELSTYQTEIDQNNAKILLLNQLCEGNRIQMTIMEKEIALLKEIKDIKNISIQRLRDRNFRERQATISSKTEMKTNLMNLMKILIYYKSNDSESPFNKSSNDYVIESMKKEIIELKQKNSLQEQPIISLTKQNEFTEKISQFSQTISNDVSNEKMLIEIETLKENLKSLSEESKMKDLQINCIREDLKCFDLAKNDVGNESFSDEDCKRIYELIANGNLIQILEKCKNYIIGCI